jgi:hypothetical protein
MKLSDYHKPTPQRARKIGKAIQHLGTTMQVALGMLQAAESPLAGWKYALAVIIIAILQWSGETITDFATEEPQEQ